MKVFKSRGFIRFLSIALVIAYTFIAPALTVLGQTEADAYISLSFNTVIDSPADGTIIKSGTNFVVQAKVTYQGISVTEKVNNLVFANNIQTTNNMALTISISGPASTQEALTKATNPSSLNPGGAGTASWTLHCDGPGDVTITITPSGMYHIINDASKVENSVFAIDGGLPIPSAYFTSATIVIHQQEEVVETPDSSSWADNTPELRQLTDARMTTTTVYAQPRQTVAGHPVTIFGNIANRGESEGKYTATLKINGEIEATKEGTLAGNIARPLEFTVYRNEPGTYKVDINGQQTYFTVVGPQGRSDSSGIKSKVIFIVIVLTLVALSLIVLFIRRLIERY